MRAAMNEIVASTRSLSVNANADESKTQEAPSSPFDEPESNVQQGTQSSKEDEQQQEEEFVNTGLQRWEKIRYEWLSSASSQYSSSASTSTSSSISSSSTVPASQPPLSSTHNTKNNTNAKNKKPKRHAQDIDIDEVIDLIVSNRWRQQAPPESSSSSNKGTAADSLDTVKNATKRREDACFPSPVALPQMVDVLLDLWEAEGLDI